MKEQKRELITHGIREYAHALNAIGAFEKLIKEKCRRAVEENQKEYTEVLGIESPQLEDFKSPKGGTDGDGDCFQLGVRFRYKSKPIGWVDFYHNIEWNCEENGDFSTIISLEAWSTKRNIDRLKEQIPHNEVRFQNTGVWLEEENLTAEDAVDIADKFNALFQKWIDFWRKVDGINAFASNDSEDDESSE